MEEYEDKATRSHFSRSQSERCVWERGSEAMMPISIDRSTISINNNHHHLIAALITATYIYKSTRTLTTQWLITIMDLGSARVSMIQRQPTWGSSVRCGR